VNIVYMGTAAFAVPTLVRLFEEGFAFTGVVTQPDKPSGRGQAMQAPPVKRKAHELHLPIYQPVTLKDDHARSLFKAMEPELIVVVAYGKILPPWLLKLPALGAVNLHASLLPKYRGAAPIQWAVANGETETGVCTMRVEEGLDTGPIYLCKATKIEPDETVPELTERLAIHGASLMVQTIRRLLSGTLEPTPQDASCATLAPILKKHHGFIDWRDSASKIHNQVRAFNPWPGAVTRFRDTTCKLLKTVVREARDQAEPGTILLTKEAFRVICGAGTLEIIQLQPENRKSVLALDFANGARIQPGEKFVRVADN